jgi:hypothetical protein
MGAVGKAGRPRVLGPARSVTLEMSVVDHAVLAEIALEEDVSQGEILRRAFGEFAQRYAEALRAPADAARHHVLEEEATAKLLAFLSEREKEETKS